MNCPECLAVVPDSYRFCLNCGVKLAAVGSDDEVETVVLPKAKIRKPEIFPTRKKGLYSKFFFSLGKNYSFIKGLLIGILIVLLIGGLIEIIYFSIATPGNRAAIAPVNINQNFPNVSKSPAVQSVEAPAPSSAPSLEKPTQTPKSKLENSNVQSRDPVYSNSNVNVNPVNREQKRVIVNETFPVVAGQYRYYSFQLFQPGRVVGRVIARGGNNDIDTIIIDASEIETLKSGNRFRAYYRSNYATVSNLDVPLNPGSYLIVFSNAKALLTNKTVQALIEIE